MTRVIRTLLLLPVAGLGLAMVADRELPAKPAKPMEDARLAPSVVLKAEVLHESDALGAPTDVEVMGSSLVIADDFAERPLQLMRRSDGVIERSFGGKGQGPREFESAWAIDVVDPAGEFMVHDLMLQRVTWVDVREDFRDGAWVADRSLKLKAETMLTETAWSPQGMVGLGFLPQGRLAHLDDRGAVVRMTGPTPLDGQEVPPEVRQQAYQSKLKPNPSRTRWAVATRFADRLEIYDAAGSLVAEGTRPYGFEPVYQAKKSTRTVSMASGDETRFGYLDVATTKSRIYALFSGRTRAEGRANYGDMVHVFDWDGRLLEAVQLDAFVISLAVDPAGSTLYGLRHDPFPAVLAFRL